MPSENSPHPAKSVRRTTYLFLLVTIFLVLSGNTFAATPTNCLSTMEKELADQINAYRNQYGLASVPFSNSLTLVAQWHVIDLHENSPDTGICNMHSWSDQHPTLWNAVCYDGDPSNFAGMWDKPREITNNAYFGNGFENAYWTSGTPTATSILDLWKKSPGHNAVILEIDGWEGKNWPAMGVGIYQGYAVLWFGDQADPQGVATTCSGGGDTGSQDVYITPIIKLLLLQ